jgi:hypothetical protein
MLIPDDVRGFISRCLGVDIQPIMEIRQLRDRAGRQVLDCLYQVGDVAERRILKVYRMGFDDDSELGVAGVARKGCLASAELSGRSIRIPVVFGCYISDDISCLLMERLEQVKWDAVTRVTAAGALARLHNVSPESLSENLQTLIRRSKPNRDRGRLGVIGRSGFLDKHYPQWRVQWPELSRGVTEIVEGVEPESSMTTLVHGDYFSVNLIPTADGLYIIDWDLLALGDPMWDLGMLVGADAGVTDREVEDVVVAYQTGRPIDDRVLRWQLSCWRTLLELIRLMREYSETRPE